MRLILIAFCFGVWLLQQQATLPSARWLWILPLLSTALWWPLIPGRFTATSSLAEFVERVHPRYGVFTVGYRNRFGHPHPQVVARFRELDSNLLRSDTGGLIQLTFGEAGVVASEYQPSHRRYWHAALLDE